MVSFHVSCHLFSRVLSFKQPLAGKVQKGEKGLFSRRIMQQQQPFFKMSNNSHYFSLERFSSHFGHEPKSSAPKQVAQNFFKQPATTKMKGNFGICGWKLFQLCNY